jgi:hypothetical protein
MSRIEYRMSAEDLRTFDRWHARGAMVLAAVLLLMPWMLGIGPNSVGPAGRHADAATTPAPAPREQAAPAPREPAAPASPAGPASGG